MWRCPSGRVFGLLVLSFVWLIVRESWWMGGRKGRREERSDGVCLLCVKACVHVLVGGVVLAFDSQERREQSLFLLPNTPPSSSSNTHTSKPTHHHQPSSPKPASVAPSTS